MLSTDALRAFETGELPGGLCLLQGPSELQEREIWIPDIIQAHQPGVGAYGRASIWMSSQRTQDVELVEDDRVFGVL